ncbi:MAG: hypothetical protein LQ350_005479 [Teloschistes chrysophthalmus]|nr:MAG: hypothetical protein LQ350_005479 [Niorma chrysophthalma]
MALPPNNDNDWKVEFDVLECKPGHQHPRGSLTVKCYRGRNGDISSVRWEVDLKRCNIHNCDPQTTFVSNAQQALNDCVKLLSDQNMKAKMLHIKSIMEAKKNEDTPANREEHEKMLLALSHWMGNMVGLKLQAKPEIVFETRRNFIPDEQSMFLSYMANTSTDISRLLQSQRTKLQSLMGQTAPLPDLKERPLTPESHTEKEQGEAQSLLGELGDDDEEEKMQQACKEWAESVGSLRQSCGLAEGSC